MTDFQVDTSTGIWHCERDAHSFDGPLANALSAFFLAEKAQHIVDVGCGNGEYVRHLRQEGLDILGVDGNPKTPQFCERCFVVDILQPEPLFITDPAIPPDWILCLEVGEHIPPKHEATFLDLITRATLTGIVLSWFPQEGHGIGHFNPKPNEYVKAKMAERGFVSDEQSQDKLRKSASLWWFQFSLMTFRRA